MPSVCAGSLHRLMNDPVPLTISQYVEAALEASCDTLMALEVIQTLAAQEEVARLQTLRTIRLTRRVIDELRFIREREPTNLLSRGFVLPADDAAARSAVS